MGARLDVHHPTARPFVTERLPVTIYSMDHSRHSFEAFTAPDSPSKKLSELQRQNELLREANAVLKEALVSVVERYKKLAERLPEEDRAVEREISVVESGPLARHLDDINTNVIQGVVGRFRAPSLDQEPSFPTDEHQCESSLSKTMEKRERLLQARQIMRELENAERYETIGSPRENDHLEVAEKATHHGHTRSLAQGSPLVNPTKRGDSFRVIDAGNANKSM